MRVAVQPNLVPSVTNHAAFFGKGLQRVTWDKPGCFDVVLGKHLEETSSTDGSGEVACIVVGVGRREVRMDSGELSTARDITRTVFSSVRP